MDENNGYEEYDDQPRYQAPSAIDPSALRATVTLWVSTALTLIMVGVFYVYGNPLFF